MCYVNNYYVKLMLVACLLLVVGCDTTKDLNPSGKDKSIPVEQQAPDFTAQDTLGSSYTLSNELATADAVVLYFTMWCPICDSHMSHMRSSLNDDFPGVSFLIVDYVTGSIQASRSYQLANGYSDMIVLVDTEQSLLKTFDASMGTTVIIDSAGFVVLNEDYKDGQKVRTTLEEL